MFVDKQLTARFEKRVEGATDFGLIRYRAEHFDCANGIDGARFEAVRHQSGGVLDTAS